MFSSHFIDDYPVIRITVGKDGRRTQARAIIDTGSPYTILPQSVLEDLDLKGPDISMTVKIHGVIHKKECEALAPAYLMSLIVGNTALRDVLIVAYDFHATIGLLGHNVLKKFELAINWKEKTIRLK